MTETRESVSYERSDKREPPDIRMALNWPEEYLSEGDYAFTAKGYLIRLERKSVDSDLLNSLESGFLAEELRNISVASDIPIWLKEGNLSLSRLRFAKPRADPMSTFNQIDNASISAQLTGVVVAHSPDASRTAQRLESIKEYFESEGHRSMQMVRRMEVPQILFDRDYNSSVQFLMCLPGIGQELAIRLLQNLKSLSGVVNASIEELTQVEGIGKKKAQGIRSFLERIWPEV